MIVEPFCHARFFPLFLCIYLSNNLGAHFGVEFGLLLSQSSGSHHGETKKASKRKSEQERISLKEIKNVDLGAKKHPRIASGICH